ncbi:MAG: hypothetical protein RI958_655 [Actinomycetota bacterium]|jgi:predicted  nucleic acid-binding Zn-ribbon protein
MNGPALLALQLIDSELDQIDGRRKRLAERVALNEAKAAHTRWIAERDRLLAVASSAGTSIEQAEAAGADLAKKQAKLEAQLKTVIAPREAEALMNEIGILVARRGELDDAELVAMEEQAEAETALEALHAIEPTLLAAIDDASAALDDALGALAADESDVRVRRSEVDASLTGSERDLYASARSRHGGIGVSRLERHTCTGCHVDLSQVEFERVRAAALAGELPECPHCARFLVV